MNLHSAVYDEDEFEYETERRNNKQIIKKRQKQASLDKEVNKMKSKTSLIASKSKAKQPIQGKEIANSKKGKKTVFAQKDFTLDHSIKDFESIFKDVPNAGDDQEESEQYENDFFPEEEDLLIADDDPDSVHNGETIDEDDKFENDLDDVLDAEDPFYNPDKD